jgi:tetratricopeptide (TPR) repeat protein
VNQRGRIASNISEERARPELFNFGKWNWAVGCAVLLIVTVLAYLPASHAGFIWDDDLHITENPALRNLEGLKHIWFQISATPQYYPMVHSSFWLESHLWGLNPLGYHLVNIFLQALGAILLWCVLREIQLPAAWLAAVIFAVHPIQVESVAWVSERKNLLSGVFYFAAALCYLRFENNDAGKRRWLRYFGALALFGAALLSKTVTCSLPAAMLLVLWWKKGRLSWKDVLPLIPFFLIGALMGLLTASLEKHHVGANGADWAFTPLDRCLIAGRALWFYAGKLICPIRLTFIYPHWKINAAVWWQWLFPLAAVCVVAVLWLWRNRIGRGPLVAVLFFVGTLFPALGFVNVYPMRFSFVADHFQYLASIGLIVLCATALGRLPRIIPGALVLALGFLTWQQAHIYRNAETLWRDTLAKNPDCWMADNNLGLELYKKGQIDDAIALHGRSIELKPNDFVAPANLGIELAAKGEFKGAITYYRVALGLHPDDPASIRNNLGVALFKAGDTEAAIKEYRQALQERPDMIELWDNLGEAFAERGRLDEAEGCFRKALKIRPDFAIALYDLGGLLADRKRYDEAIACYEAAVRSRSDFFEANFDLAATLVEIGRTNDAAPYITASLRIPTMDPQAHFNLGRLLLQLGRRDEAVGQMKTALRLKGDYAEAKEALRALGVAPN